MREVVQASKAGNFQDAQDTLEGGLQAAGDGEW